MSGDILTLGAIVALAAFVWRLNASLRHDLTTRMDRLETRMETRLDRIEADLTGVKEELAFLKGQVELLLRGLHIEVSGRQ